MKINVKEAKETLDALADDDAQVFVLTADGFGAATHILVMDDCKGLDGKSAVVFACDGSED